MKMRTVLISLVFAALCAVVLAGQSGAQAPEETAPPRESGYSVLVNSITNLLTKNPDAPALLTAYPSRYDPVTGLGPHEEDLLAKGAPPTYNASGKKAYSCQIDCTSLFQLAPGLKIPIFGSCRTKYYSYGVFKDYGCKTPVLATAAQFTTAVALCSSHCGCNLATLSRLSNSVISLPIMRTATGRNAGKDGTLFNPVSTVNGAKVTLAPVPQDGNRVAQ
jgi:hypothetical protein